jgi:hypothetical protein
MLDRPRPPPKPPPTGQAARSRRYRANLKAGRASAWVEYGAGELDFLIATRWLDERDAGNRRKVGLAIAAMLRDSARR